jgi:predicted dehydrogenase
MGFNRNFSKYVLLAKDFLPQAPAEAVITAGRTDYFQTPEMMDECFERNAEGMLKNMMIHEIVVLVSHFGLRADEIEEIVCDKKYTCHEIRKGFADFSKMGCTLRMKDGRNFVLWGSRSGGEYAECSISWPGASFKTVRPDAEVSRVAAELEAATPGCPPFFYIQDGEYLLLKERIVQHVAEGKKGNPEGVCTIQHAIEGLKVCDLITVALVKG